MSSIGLTKTISEPVTTPTESQKPATGIGLKKTVSEQTGSDVVKNNNNELYKAHQNFKQLVALK